MKRDVGQLLVRLMDASAPPDARVEDSDEAMHPRRVGLDTPVIGDR